MPEVTSPTAPRSKVRPEPGAKSVLVVKASRLDAQGRLSLKRVVRPIGEDVESFDVYLHADGSIVLQPKISVPAREAWLFKNRAALESVRRGIAQARAGELEDLGSFARHADED